MRFFVFRHISQFCAFLLPSFGLLALPFQKNAPAEKARQTRIANQSYPIMTTSGLRKLGIIEGTVEAAEGKQLIVRALLDDAAVLYN